jgi:hypothetical protein
MAYPDDKSMTKMGRYVHVLVMLVGYTFVPDAQINNPLLATWSIRSKKVTEKRSISPILFADEM